MSLWKQATSQLANQKACRRLGALVNGVDESLGSQREILGEAERRRSDGTSRSALDGCLIAVKDNICTAVQHTSCGSALLDGFLSPYRADVIRKLEDAGAIVAGKTNLDEFGMGSNSTLSHHGVTRNVYSDKLSAGGSSGGSAVAVASNQCFAALGTDTGGSVRLPAAYNGIVGFKPSYGMISRWGVVAYANSLDTVGILARKVADAGKVFGVLHGPARNDPTLLRPDVVRHADPRGNRTKLFKKLKIGVPAEYNTDELQPLVRASWMEALQRLQAAGHETCPISLPATKLALSAYYVLAPAEASSNLAKYDGARYGNRLAEENDDSSRGESVLYAKTRGHGLGQEVRRRILLGAYSLSAGAIDNYFIQAQRIRRLVQSDYNRAFILPNPLVDPHESADASDSPSPKTPDEERPFEKVDLIVAPTAQSLPPKLADLEKYDGIDAYGTDGLTVPASLAGLPVVNVPMRIPEDHLAEAGAVHTVGMQVIGQFGHDDYVLQASEALESILK